MKTYPQSVEILEKIETAKNILLALHVNPDTDSVGSNLALAQFLKEKGKRITVLSCDKPPENLSFLPSFSTVVEKDIYEADLSGFDLYISLDSAEKQRVSRHTEELLFPESLAVVVIDHHYSNPKYGNINLVDEQASSTGEILHHLFTQWGCTPNLEVATCLLAAILGDTGTFRWATSSQTLQAAAELVAAGASLKDINFYLYQDAPLKSYKYLSRVFEKMETLDVGEKKVVWAALSFDEINILGGPKIAHGASEFLATVADTDFGLNLTEEEKGRVNGSLRARTQVNVAELASLFGGGGHPTAAGFSVRFEGEFEPEVQRILQKIKEKLA